MNINKELIGNSMLIQQGFELEYYMMEINMDKSEQQKAYGIEIVKKQNNKIIESSREYEVSKDKTWTKNVIAKLAKNTVTPIALNDVIRDIKM